MTICERYSNETNIVLTEYVSFVLLTAFSQEGQKVAEHFTCISFLYNVHFVTSS